MWLHTIKSKVRYWAGIQYLQLAKRWPRKSYRRWSLSATLTTREKAGNTFSGSWSPLSGIRKSSTIQGGILSRMVNILQDTWAFHNNLILWREWAVSVLVLLIRMAASQEAHHLLAGNDFEINSCFLTCSAIFTILEWVCSKNIFTLVQENSPWKRQLWHCLHGMGCRHSVRDQYSWFSCCTGVWMPPSHFQKCLH